MRSPKTIGVLSLLLATICFAQEPYHNSLAWRAQQWAPLADPLSVGLEAQFMADDAPDGYLTNLLSRVNFGAMTNYDTATAATNYTSQYGFKNMWFTGDGVNKIAYFKNMSFPPSNSITIWMAAQAGNWNYIYGDKVTLWLKRGDAGTSEYLRYRSSDAWSWNEGTTIQNITTTNTSAWVFGTLCLVRSNNAGAVTMYGSANGETYVQGFTTTSDPASNIVFVAFGQGLTGNGFSGQVYELRVYDRILSQAEVTALNTYANARYPRPLYDSMDAMVAYYPTNVVGPDGTTTNRWLDLARWNSSAWQTTNAAMQAYKTNTATHPAMAFIGGQGLIISNLTSILTNDLITPNYGFTYLVDVEVDSFATAAVVGMIPKSEGSILAGVLAPATDGESKITFGGRRLAANSFVGLGIPATTGVRYAVVASFDYYNAIATIYTNGVKAGEINPFQTGGAYEETFGTTAPSIGFSNSQFGQQFFKGKIGRFIICSKALRLPDAVRFYNEMQ